MLMQTQTAEKHTESPWKFHGILKKFMEDFRKGVDKEVV